MLHELFLRNRVGQRRNVSSTHRAVDQCATKERVEICLVNPAHALFARTARLKRLFQEPQRGERPRIPAAMFPGTWHSGIIPGQDDILSPRSVR